MKSHIKQTHGCHISIYWLPNPNGKISSKKTFINTRPWWWKPFQLNEEDRYLSQSNAVPEAEEWILSKIKYLLLITCRKRRAEQYTIHFQIIILTLNTKKKASMHIFQQSPHVDKGMQRQAVQLIWKDSVSCELGLPRVSFFKSGCAFKWH